MVVILPSYQSSFFAFSLSLSSPCDTSAADSTTEGEIQINVTEPKCWWHSTPLLVCQTGCGTVSSSHLVLLNWFSGDLPLNALINSHTLTLPADWLNIHTAWLTQSHAVLKLCNKCSTRAVEGPLFPSLKVLYVLRVTSGMLPVTDHGPCATI